MKKVILKLCQSKLRIAYWLTLIIQVYILIVDLSSVSVECAKLNKEGNFPPGLFTDIIKAYRETNHKVKILNFDSDMSFVDKVIQATADGKPYEIQQSDTSNQKYLNITDSAIMTFKSVKSLEQFNQYSEFLNKFYKSFYFLQIFQRASYEELVILDRPIRYISPSLYGYTTANSFETDDVDHHQYYLIEEVNFWRLLTSIWYAPGKCNVRQLSEVNRFDKNTNRWNSSTFKITKFHNFHGCQLEFGVYNQTGAFQYSELEDGSFKNEGYHYEIINALSKPLNYTIFFNHMVNHTLYQKTGTKIDLVVVLGCNNQNDLFGLDYSFITQPYIFEYSYMAVPPSESYDGYEKLLLPFDEHVWILIILTFVVTFSVILVVSNMKAETQNFVFGAGVRTPSLNVTIAFFGLGQIVLPRRNFARFILMLFIMYCLIIRTAWQGKMFEFLQKDMTKPEEIQSFDELIEKNFTFFMDESFTTLFRGSDIMDRVNISGYDGDEFYDVLYNKIYDPHLGGAVQVHSRDYHETFMRSRGEIKNRLIKEPFKTESCGMNIIQNHRMFEILDLKTQQLVTGGIIDYFIAYNKKLLDSRYYKQPLSLTKDYLEDVYVKSFPEGPQVLTLEHLEAGFVVWLACISFALFSFLFEWIIRLKDFLLIKYILSSFYKVQRLRPNRRILEKIKPASPKSESTEENEIDNSVIIEVGSETDKETDIDLIEDLLQELSEIV